MGWLSKLKAAFSRKAAPSLECEKKERDAFARRVIALQMSRDRGCDSCHHGGTDALIARGRFLTKEDMDRRRKEVLKYRF